MHAANTPRPCPCCGRSHAPAAELFEGVRLSVLMPVYNERQTVAAIVERVLAVKVSKELIIVDDGSTDGTVDVLEKLVERNAGTPGSSLRVIRHPSNLGKGAAVARAAATATGDVAIVQDADLEYSPEEYCSLLMPILRNEADVVYGSRFGGGSPRRVPRFWQAVGSRLIALLSSMFTNLYLTDVQAGPKAFRTELLQSIPIRQKGFGFEIEITSRIARRKCRVFDVGISYVGRTGAAGKKRTWRDGLRALALVLKYR